MQEATQEAPAQEVKTEVQEPETMQEVLDKYGDNVHFRRGEVRKGTIISKSENGYLIDVGFKCEGVLPMKEYTNHVLIEEPDSEPKPGDAIDVEIVSVRDGDDAQLLLSRWHNEFDKRWDALASALKENPVIEVKGVSKVKGGLMVNAGGLEAFIPVSQLTLAGRGANPQNFVGQTLTVKVLDLDKRKHRLVFSRRSLLEEAENERKAKFYERVHEGDIVEGEVSSLTDFGVFVNIGEMDGLVHLTEITWKRSFKIKDMFKKGDKVTVKVIGIDREKDRISLSMKQVAGDPWDTVDQRIHKGDVMT
ncbi:MAG: S1 RNA-binding domain-containing protein, partial [Synergistaceae bacterium]|nr:S1 RNA-binding domain-containing protein [Synergistaceae bacterium]